MTTKNNHGELNDGTPITDEMIEAMADEAERGYELGDGASKRRGGRPRIGSKVASVESVRLDPELKRDLLLQASDEGVSLSELIRKALRHYVDVQAS